MTSSIMPLMQRMVFLSPAMPDFQGNGLSMRAAQNLRALASRYEIHLCVLDLYGPERSKAPEAVASLCTGCHIVQLPASARKNFRQRLGFFPVPDEWRQDSGEKRLSLTSTLQSCRPDLLWVFRFYLIPWITPWLGGPIPVWLDLDELESSARLRLSRLPSMGPSAREARFYLKKEKQLLPRFQRLFSASSVEQAAILKQHRLHSEVWPNVVDLPSSGTPPPSKPSSNKSEFFFIGSIGYAPNRDAIRHTLREILPRFRILTGREAVLTVAGRGAAAHRHEFEKECGLNWIGEVDNPGEFYQRSDAVVAPLRSGGGTRIKILEAFAHRRPVVSTSIGAEGLGVHPGKELILADDPASFARALADLSSNPASADALATQGYAFVLRHHHPEVLARLAAGL